MLSTPQPLVSKNFAQRSTAISILLVVTLFLQSHAGLHMEMLFAMTRMISLTLLNIPTARLPSDGKQQTMFSLGAMKKP